MPIPTNSGPHKDISVNSFDWVDFAKSLKPKRIIRRIPKGARASAAILLTALLNDVAVNGYTEAWMRLFMFTSVCLSRPAEKVQNLTTFVKDSITRFATPSLASRSSHKDVSGRGNSKPGSTRSFDLRKAVGGKLSQGDVQGAVRLLSSTDSMAPNDPETHETLRNKHPALPADVDLSLLAPIVPSKYVVTPKDVRKAIQSFRKGSSGGWEGLCPQHLQDLTSPYLGESANVLVEALVGFVNRILQGNLPDQLARVFFGARLIALKKKSGGIRPIAVGLTLRRLVGKVGNSMVLGDAIVQFSPQQVGYGVKGGCEATVHALRSFLANNDNSGYALLKIDFCNAFNTIRRDHLISLVNQNYPDLAPFIYNAYAVDSALFWQDKVLTSAEGVQQGDPLGPFLFCLGMRDIIKELTSQINVWYLDDGTLIGDVNSVANDFANLKNLAAGIGLQINASKCECAILSRTETIGLETISALAPEITRLSFQEVSLLGAPLHERGVDTAFRQKLTNFSKLCKNVLDLDKHDALFLLKNSLSVPRVTYLLRTSPCFNSPVLQEYDDLLLDTLKQVLNCDLSENQWARASLPVATGGLGIRATRDVALPAFLSSVKASFNLSRRINHTYVEDQSVRNAIEAWDALYNSQPCDNSCVNQKAWDTILAKTRVEEMLHAPGTDDFTRATILAAMAPGSGDWLNALPLPQLGLKLNNNELRIAAGLRLGSDVIHPHTCICGQQADAKGVHGLSCHKTPGRRVRHTMANRLIHRALNSAQFLSVMEPPGLSTTDGKRPDGLTLVPWRRGRSLIWDFSCCTTISTSALRSSARKAGSAAEEGAKAKVRKYEELSTRYEFVPLVVESHGSVCSKASQFFTELGKQLEIQTGEPRASEFFRQSISIAIQKGNALSILGTPGEGGEENSLAGELAEFG